MQEEPDKQNSESNIDSERSNGGSDADTWGADQKRRRYYYDDSHGYEVYKPESEEEDCEESEK